MTPAPDPGFQPRPLLIAEAANPEWVSVPLIGWSLARAIQARTGAHIVTQIRNRDAFLRAGLAEGVDFTAIDSERVARTGRRIGRLLGGRDGRGWTALMASAVPAYLYFERLVWRAFADRLRSGEFSLVHRITPLSPTLPSPIAAKCARLGVPFIIGPLNGGVPWPRAFDGERRREREWLSYVRGAYKLLPHYRGTRRHASAILCGSRHTLGEMPEWCRRRCVYMPENGIDPARFTTRRTKEARLPLRCIFLGRLVPYKGCDMLLEAAAPFARAGALTIQVIGDGPERPRLHALAEQLGIAAAVEFLGQIPHESVQHHLAAGDLLTFPSIREFGGGAVLEALAVGLPVMAVAYGGPAELMSPHTCFPIEIGSRERIVGLLRRTLETVVADPSLIDARSRAAAARVDELFAWPAKAAQVLRVYEAVLARGRELPRFSFADGGEGSEREQQTAAVTAVC